MNSYYQTGLRNLLDRSVLSHDEFEVERTCQKVDEIPFDFIRKRMSVVVDYEGDRVLICKGAVENVFKVCQRYQIDDEVFPLIEAIKADILEDYQTLSADGYRVLAIAYRNSRGTRRLFPRRTNRPDPSGLHRLLRSAEGDRRPGDPGAEEGGRRGQGPHGGQRPGHPQDLQGRGHRGGARGDGSRARGTHGEKRSPRSRKRTPVFARLSPAQKEDIIQALQAQGTRGRVPRRRHQRRPGAEALRTSASRSTRPWTWPRSPRTSSCWKRASWCSTTGSSRGARSSATSSSTSAWGRAPTSATCSASSAQAAFLPFLPMLPIQVLINNLLYDISQIGIPADHVDAEFTRSPASGTSATSGAS